MIDQSYKYRVFNKAKYDIGVTLTNGQQPVIKTGAFLPLIADEILYIESVCGPLKLFSEKILVPTDHTGKEYTLEELGGYSYTENTIHMTDEEIQAALKKPLKQFEVWVDSITSPEEQYCVFCIASQNETLPTNKMNVLRKKMPQFDWLHEAQLDDDK